VQFFGREGLCAFGQFYKEIKEEAVFLFLFLAPWK
jgi:hypothetical protein